MVEAQERFIEEVGRLFETDGVPRIAGRLFALLLLSPEELSLDEMAERLSVSRASVSTDARRMEECGFLERVTRKGDRKDYYRISSNHYTSMLERRLSALERFIAVVDRGKDLPGITPPVRQRVCNLTDWCHSFSETIKNHMQSYKEKMAVQSARPSVLIAILLAGLAMFAGAQGAWAQTAPAAGTAGVQTTSDTVTLSLEEALRLALNRSREVQLARAQVRIASTQVTSARAQALPQITGDFTYTRTYRSPFQMETGPVPDSMKFEPDPSASLEDRVTYLEDNAPNAAFGALGSMFSNLPFGRPNTYNAQLTGTQVLYSGGRVGAALKIAKRYQEAAEFTYNEQVAEIELQVRTAYFQATLANELESIANAALGQAQAFYDQEDLRFKAGTTSELDVLRAEVALENLRPQQVEARNANEIATLNLKRLLDIPLTQPVLLTTSLVAPDAATAAQTASNVNEQLARRSSILAAERGVAIKEQQVSIARGAYLPSLGLQVVYGRQIMPNKVFGFSDAEWQPNFTATVAVQLPIFTGFKRNADVQNAKLELEQARLQLSQLRSATQLEYEQARGERERALSSIAARQRTVDQATRVYDLTVLRYEKGLATQLEASDARLSLLQARTNLAQAISDYYIADANVAKALGARPTVTGAAR